MWIRGFYKLGWGGIIKLMTKSKKIILGIATIWPILYTVFFFLLVFSQFLFVSSGGSLNELPIGISLIFPLYFITIILMFVLIFIYVKNVFKNDRIQDKKALWVVAIFLGSYIAMPIYWYLYIWKEPRQEQHSEQKT